MTARVDTSGLGSPPRSTTAALQMSGVTKSFGPALVLDGVDLDVRAGEIHALMGENGAGKSTLIKCLTGVTRMDQGTVTLLGESVDIRTASDARANGIAVVHQELSVIPNLSITDNLFLARELRRGVAIDRARMRRESVGLLARLGLDIDPDTLVVNLDVAERQAVEICRALAEDARILVLDEPTAALTNAERERLFDVLEQLRAEGLALLYVSHHLGEIRRLADRVTVLRNGRTVFTRRMAEVTEDEIVFAMLGEPAEDLFPVRGDVASSVALDARGIRYGRKVDGVDITVRRGEILGLTGLIGAGDRELGRVLAGVAHPTGGTLDRQAEVIRFVPGDRKSEGLALARTGRENLTVYVLDLIAYGFRGWRFLSRKREIGYTDAVAERLKLRGDVAAPVELLSGGNQQKILIGRALDGSADVIVLEEPTRGVDVGARADLYRLLREQADRGTAIVVVSSDLREVAGLSDRVLVLSRGAVAAELEGDALTESAVYRAAHSEPADGIASADTAARTRRMPWLRRVVSDEAFIPWAAFIVLAVVAALGSSVFLTGENVQNLSRQSVTTGLVGLGQLFVVLAGHVDLSMGANVGLSNLISADLLMQGVPYWIVAPAVLAVGAAIGAVNALLVRLGMPALLATFAMASVLRGVIVWMYPQSIGPVPEEIWIIDRHEVLGIPTSFLALVLILAFGGWLLRSTRFGRHLFATGGDLVAARLSGVRTDRVTAAAFIIAGVLAAAAGLYLTSRVGAGLPNSGTGLEFDALAVVMIGGASLAGGRGSIRGMVAGLGIVVILANMMNLMGLDAFLQNPIKGTIIVIVAILWAMRERARRRRAELGYRSEL